ncbi:site-specific integrase [Halalkalibacter akibai]|uniref:Integrase n=1 Tax=Halalkalibacter akibai (strain ATCC 43226 / DSM 21942 / CIP 109018 / JCM 9157 / 1139) TaxID=1236973 RepID=W4QXU6_HALA3|nr:site-specific integrase [Halalkalibacter akibai]GAE36463.1 integrase [Halalkalibacter akibai JCM 9157]
MRVGELVCLQWDDIDFDKQTIRIIKTYYNPKNNPVEFNLNTPKTVASARTIVVEEDVIEALKELKATQEKVKERLGHTHTSLLAELEVPLEDIMERLGHTDDETTRLVYRHLTKEMKKKAVSSFYLPLLIFTNVAMGSGISKFTLVNPYSFFFYLVRHSVVIFISFNKAL